MKRFIYILTIGLTFMASTSFGQGVKIERFKFQLDGKTYNGSFAYTFKFFENLPPDKAILKPGNYYFNISQVNSNVPKIFFLEIKGRSITWDNNLEPEITEDLALVIQKGWITEDRNGILKPKSRPACIYSPSGILQLEYEFKKEGNGKSIISYGVKLPGKDCKNQVQKNGSFEFSYKIDLTDHFTIELDTGKKPIPTTPAPTSTSTLPVDKETIAWENCLTLDPSNSKACLKSYIQLYPNGKNTTEAQKRYDNILWIDAKNSNTLSKYEFYLNNSYLKNERTSALAAIEKIKQDNQPLPPKDPMEEAWKTATNQHTKKAYKFFLEKYSKSKHAKKAVIFSTPIQVSPLKEDQENNWFQLSLKNVINPTIRIEPDSTGTIDRSKFNARNNFEFAVSLENRELHTLYFSDKSKPSEVASLAFPLDNFLKASMEQIGDSLLFTFENGKPPYSVYFKNGNQHVYFIDSIEQNSYRLAISDVGKNLKSSATLSVEVWDAFMVKKMKNEVLVEKESFPWQYVAAGIAALALIFFGRSIYKKSQQKKFKALNEKRKKEQGIQSAKPVAKPIPTKTKEIAEENVIEVVDMSDEIPATEEGIATEETISFAAAKKSTLADEGKSSGLKIKKVRKAHLPKASIDTPHDEGSAVVNKENYFFLPQKQHWEDTIISEIGFSKKSISHIDKFLRDQNINESGEMMEEVDGTIPEIGGLLMGNCMHFKNQNHYIVTIEEFIPINPEFNNVYRLEFSTQSLAKELGDAQDEFPDLALVGWFHTHPGHGLFLSKPDLTIHEGFFREPYQFAMEIDSRTVNFDTGFFTRKKDGQVNNREHKKLHSTWFAWTEIEKFMRQKG